MAHHPEEAFNAKTFMISSIWSADWLASSPDRRKASRACDASQATCAEDSSPRAPPVRSSTEMRSFIDFWALKPACDSSLRPTVASVGENWVAMLASRAASRS
ncbi:MAG: hypothetical protein EOO70_00635 [Myxococcaceae bacterium]|nr:MAG: hypothetical protein EOO70_00635 [Myxococcaceae bacterium]